MHIVVIGGTGHVGGYLVPDLVGAGHSVTVVSRGVSAPYRWSPEWDSVRMVVADREAGSFGALLAALEPDAVVDLVCFSEASARSLVAAMTGFLVHVGTIWVHGTATEVPITEDAPRRPWGEYGIAKAAIERYLLTEAAPALDVAIVHPGHISGPGWPVINPQGNLDLAVWRRLALGETVALPNFGLETVHHVHAADVAALIRLCLDNRAAAAGNAFHAVSSGALTLRGFAEAAARWFGLEADLEFLPFDEFRTTTTEENARTTYEHVARSHSVSIEKARRTLGFRPAYTSLEAVAESVEWLRLDGRLGPDLPPVSLLEDGS